jgi:hypothetical protein
MFQPPPLAGVVLHSLDQDVCLIWLCVPPTRRASWFYVRCWRCFWTVCKKWPVGRFVVCNYPLMLSTESSLCSVVNKQRSIKFYISSSAQASSLFISLQFSFSVYSQIWPCRANCFLLSVVWSVDECAEHYAGIRIRHHPVAKQHIRFTI